MTARLRTVSHVTVREGGSDRAGWRKRAACLDEDPELFFPVGAGEAYQPQIDDAKAVCARCPVKKVCLEWALDTRQGFGVWGGLDEDERVSLLRREYRARAKRERPIKHGTEGGYRTHHRRGEDPCSACSTAANAAHERRKAQRARKAAKT